MTAAPPPRPLRATYRLQLGPDCTFDEAARLTRYLAALGISDCYTSPFFEACAPGSHGYDVCDHNRLDEALGGEAGFRRLADALRAHGLGLVIDVVPNHMGIAGNRNAWWNDVLEHGPASPFARVFDIEWVPVKPELAGKVLLPILGDHYGATLESGQLRLTLADGVFTIRYHDRVLPVAPRSYGRILGHRIDDLQATLGPDHPALLELKTLIAWFVTLPPRDERDPERLAARRRDRQRGVERLAALLRESPEIRAFVDDNVARLNGTPGDPASFDLLDDLLDDQAYRLAYWRVAGEEINYRRFFDVNELAAIRMEESPVFADTHALIVRLVAEAPVTALRIDHPDGLYAPTEYFRRLRAAVGRPVAILAEKVLAPGERLPAAWPVEGTTGYEFLNLLNGIFVDRSQARAMEQIYARLIKERPPFAEVVYASKRLIMDTSMAAELNMLAHRLNGISEKHRSSRDFTLMSLMRALSEIVANFPVYRTYVGDSPAGPSEADREYIARAVGNAKRRTPTLNVSIYDWIQDILTLRHPAWATDADRQARLDFAMRFQQITAPVTAKGYEDTALYRFARLISLNEVGGDPNRFGASLAEFHAAMAERQRQHPGGLSTTATHDTKRGEDVRARIDVLSEIPREWRARVGVWQRLNRHHRTAVDGRPVPGPNTEYFIYQTLIGAWPITVDRLRPYLSKAVREAKSHTSWTNPNPRYDEAIARFAEALLDPERSRAFLDDFTPFQARVARYGMLNSLAQTLVKITTPGVPDFYQGTELWDLSLVDPDNRRPVDFDVRERLLASLADAVEGRPDLAGLAADLWAKPEDGRVKLFVIRQALACRRARAELFAGGEYRPLEVEGELTEHVCAFARVAAGDAVVTLVPRLLARRQGGPPLGMPYWGETRVRVPAAVGTRFHNVLTGEQVETSDEAVAVGRALRSFPVALLEREAG
ncbi:MAG TPA: malto-oligosyltrehalose synthase [Methylomirabilota bacterium]|nr:malto-oligosyltrehalose synthase [Methylomirabilota bacterium]